MRHAMYNRLTIKSFWVMPFLGTMMFSSHALSALEEVVVTATKRSQSLSDVGLTVTAMSGDKMRELGISNVADLATQVPGLTYAPSLSSSPVYTLRGIGFFESTLAAYPDVSLYMDQAPLPFPIMADLVAFDLERVEILKGPQGTLFGNNATGGAINFIAEKPTNELAAGLNVSYGRFQTLEAEGFVSGPLSPELRGRLAVKSVRADDWQRSYDTPGDTLGEKDNTAARMLLNWTPAENLDVTLNINGWRKKDDPIGVQMIAYNPEYEVGAAGFGGVLEENEIPIQSYEPYNGNSGRDAGWTPGLPYQDNEFWQVSLRFDYSFGNDLTLTSITSRSDAKIDAGIESDGTYLILIDLLPDQGDIESFSQELRLSNDPSNDLRWMVGLNYEDSEVSQSAGYYYPDTTSTMVNGISVNIFESDQEMDNRAVFANLEYDFSEAVTLRGGLRYTEADRDSISNLANHPFLEPRNGAEFTVTEFFNLAWPVLFGDLGYEGVLQPGDNIALDTRTDANGNPVNPDTYLKPNVKPQFELEEDNVSWSLGVDYRLTDDVLIYVNVMKGYKAGSMPTLSGSIYEAYEPVEQESLVDYEAGFKARLWNGRASLNGAAFFYDYENKQLRAKFVDPIFNQLDKLLNVPKSEVTGAELEFTALVTDALEISVAGTWLDSEVTEYEGAVGSTMGPMGFEPINASYAGVELPYTPEWSYAVRTTYTFDLSAALQGFASVGLTGQSDSVGVLTPVPARQERYSIDSYSLLDMNIGIRSRSADWELALWGKNLTDEYYWHSAVPAFDTDGRYPGRPAEYGVRAAYRF
ncbi:TonB-dependent receptor [Kineobactrum sediminis]|uniref:TonB-dependent receptor n=1 Tax=Kineobactrum sediminis TaxID=1905677 RepID=A0A2N5Y075_9GAMM|nr:TonB-dependent receptor [Kineobactrum sediminis]